MMVNQDAGNLFYLLVCYVEEAPQELGSTGVEFQGEEF